MKQSLARSKLAFEDKLVRIALTGSVIPLICAAYFVITSGMSVYLIILIVFIMLVIVCYAAFTIRQHVIFQLRTSTNLIEAMTSGDYSLRANNRDIQGSLSDFNELLNTLAQRLAQQSLITREKQILLAKVTDQIDVAIIAVDNNSNITLMNPASELLFKKRFSEVQGWPIKSIGLQNALSRSIDEVTEFEIQASKRKVYVRTDTYFELGKKHHLIFITDIGHLLRNEERLAWQKLLRVLSHEINNSLTPISSISETLGDALQQQLPTDTGTALTIDDSTRVNLTDGLALISERAHSLNHFIQDYQRLARLPEPNKQLFSLLPFVKNICHMFEEATITLPPTDLPIYADREQLQQVLVNLLKNAHEANINGVQRSTHIDVLWHINNAMTHIEIADNGNGIDNIDNLFVPFYTTKKQGSGIGLTLSRQIALNHGGDLHLANIQQAQSVKISGAKAILILPATKQGK